MKNLKFRAWSRDPFYDYYNEEHISKFVMVEVQTIHFTTGKIGGIYYKDNKKVHGYYDEFELLQYIGLKDIRNKEIYTGDIVKAFFDKDKLNDFLYLQFTEQELEQGYKIMVIDNINMSLPDDVEIIGNKFENPELI